MADIQQVNFVPTEWGPKVEGWLHQIDGIERHIDAMQSRIASGEYQALTIEADGETVGAVVWSVEHEPRGAVVVVNALAGRPVPGLDLSKLALAFVARVGRASGAVAVRFWTDRRGLVRKMQGQGFRMSYVMEGRL